MTDQELIYALALQHVPKIGSTTAKKLINHCGSPEGVLKENKSKLLKIDGIGAITIEGLNDYVHMQEAERELRFIRDNNIKVHYFLEAQYPERLKQCVDGPILLFQSGHINLGQHYIISVVGTRKITTKGIAFTEKLIDALSPYNPIIVSGFAYGTDITAQNTAVKHNLQTIGCLAHGLNQIYPKIHKKYVGAIEAHGGFYSDFWSSDDFDRNNFLKRNRIIAGLSEATIVVESAEKGGSLVTADIANSYNREVFAVPGRPSDTQSVGCNDLIKFQKAHLLSNPMDIPFILNWKLEKEDSSRGNVQKQLFVELDEDEKVVIKFLKENDKELLDVIAINCEIPIYKLVGILLNLELKGLIRPLPGKQFEII